MLCVEGVLLFGATLVYSALRWCGVLSPPPPLPAQLLSLPCMPKPVDEAVPGAGAAAGGKGYWSALGSPPLRPPQGLCVGSNETVEDAQGNPGLSRLQDAPSALRGGAQRY